MTKEEIQAPAWKCWEKVNNEIQGGINPTPFVLGYRYGVLSDTARKHWEPKWIPLTENQKPLAVQSGNWDGLKSEPYFVKNKDGFSFVAVMYEGTLDGSHFRNFYDANSDFEIHNVTHYLPTFND